MSLFISKSQYCQAVQCPKMLWLRKHKPETYDASVQNQSVLENGNQVGDLAMGLFGAFTEVPYAEPAQMIADTQELLAQGVQNIAEASFSADGAFCSVDILRNLGGGEVELYEVKSSTSVKEIYHHDVAYQYYVLTHCGLRVRKAALVYVNSKYVRRGALDLQQLFAVEDLTEKALEMQPGVEAYLAELETYLAQDEEPDHCFGNCCYKPYDCGCRAYCFRNLPTPNVFDMSNMQMRSKVKYYEAGNASFEALAKNCKLSAKQSLQVRHQLEDLPDYIEADAIRSFLQELTLPLYFLDFESFQPAVPPYDGAWPYEQIPFQYSLHILRRAEEEPEHLAFLAEPGADPRRAVAQRLCRDIPEDACVVAYNMSFEKSRIQELAELFPEYAAHLMRIHDNLHDLMVPFREMHYYNRAMQGSYSIKYVLPALFPDDPALDYANLEGVQNGQEASEAFPLMARMDEETLRQTRESLLRYCGLDTYALVKVWQRLHGV